MMSSLDHTQPESEQCELWQRQNWAECLIVVRFLLQTSQSNKTCLVAINGTIWARLILSTTLLGSTLTFFGRVTNVHVPLAFNVSIPSTIAYLQFCIIALQRFSKSWRVILRTLSSSKMGRCVTIHTFPRALRAGCYRRSIRPTGIVTDLSGLWIQLHVAGVIIILWSM
jgi:hypothetical protein